MRARLCDFIFPFGIPLAWCQLLAQKKRFLTAVAGVVFAVTLMMFQLGVYYGIMRKVVLPHHALAADLVMTSRDYNNFYSSSLFTMRRLYQAEEHPGVATVAPLYIDYVMLRSPDTLASKRITVFGILPTSNPFASEEINSGALHLKDEESALFDAASQPEFGPIPALVAEHGAVLTEANGKRLSIRGLFRIGGTISSSGHIIVGENSFGRIAPQRQQRMINIGTIKLAPGYERAAVAAELSRRLAPDVRVIDKETFIQEEQDYWQKRSPIAFVFLGTMIVAMVVGAVIVYQILYTDVTDHLHEYATLKAIGYDDSFFTALVLQQSVILLVSGFVPGLALTEALFAVTRSRSAMPVALSLGQSTIVFLLAFIMCAAAGMLALRRLRSADPAEVF